MKYIYSSSCIALHGLDMYLYKSIFNKNIMIKFGIECIN